MSVFPFASSLNDLLERIFTETLNILQWLLRRGCRLCRRCLRPRMCPLSSRTINAFTVTETEFVWNKRTRKQVAGHQNLHLLTEAITQLVSIDPHSLGFIEATQPLGKTMLYNGCFLCNFMAPILKCSNDTERRLLFVLLSTMVSLDGCECKGKVFIIWSANCDKLRYFNLNSISA